MEYFYEQKLFRPYLDACPKTEPEIADTLAMDLTTLRQKCRAQSPWSPEEL